MAAARGDKLILANVLRLLFSESISLREQLGNAIRIIVEKERECVRCLCLRQILDISAFALCFDSIVSLRNRTAEGRGR